MKLLSSLIAAALLAVSFSASADHHMAAPADTQGAVAAPAMAEEHKHDGMDEHSDAAKAERKAQKAAEKAAKKEKKAAERAAKKAKKDAEKAEKKAKKAKHEDHEEHMDTAPVAAK